MFLQTTPNTIYRTAVDLICRRMSLGGVPDANYRGSHNLSDKPTLRDIANICVKGAPASEQANWSSQSDFATRAMSTSDFNAILADVSNKQLAAVYASRPASFTRWASPGSLPNFKPVDVCRVSAPGLLPELRESDSYKALTLEDGSETVRMKTYGGLLGITRQTIVNDDLDALGDLNRLLAQSAALTQATIATSALTGNSILSDGTPVFHASRGNILSGVGSALSADSLSDAVAVMRRFSDVNGQPLMIEPKFLVVGPGNERIAYQLAYSDADPGTNNAGTVNFIKKSIGLEVIVDPLFESASLKAWYLLPDPAIVPVIRYFTLDGYGLAPFVESQQMFKQDQMEMKTRIDFAAAPIGYFGVKSTGE